MMRALDLAEAVDAGELSPAGLIELAAEAIGARESAIGAFTTFDLERARIAALRNRGNDGFYGLPLGVKDIIDTADFATEYGSPIYAGHRPKADAAIIGLLERAQGIVLGKTTTTEFAYLHPTATKNPHHPERTPGGSSAGSAAAVAAGMVPLALGTQTGGSMIRPASFCGVAAIKPSYRLLPMAGIKPSSPLLDTLGLFGARVVDVAFGLSALSGRKLRVDGEDFGTPRFGVTRLDFAGEAAPASQQALETAIGALNRAGGRVEFVQVPPEFAEAHAIHGDIQGFEAAQVHGFEHRYHRAALSPILLAALDRGAAIDVERFDAARRIANRARKACRPLFERVDALLTFSAVGAAPTPETTGDPKFNKLFTLLGVPCVNVPGCVDSDGMPVGLQVVSAFGEDRRALAAAAFLEAALAK